MSDSSVHSGSAIGWYKCDGKDCPICAASSPLVSAEVKYRERLKKLSFLITGNDYALLAENPQIEEALKVYVENANEAPVVSETGVQALKDRFKKFPAATPEQWKAAASVLTEGSHFKLPDNWVECTNFHGKCMSENCSFHHPASHPQDERELAARAEEFFYHTSDIDWGKFTSEQCIELIAAFLKSDQAALASRIRK